MQSRKEFLKNTMILSAGTVLIKTNEGKIFSAAGKKKAIYFDLHSHPGLSLAAGTASFDSGAPFDKTIKEMNEGHLTGAFFSLIADAPLLKVGPTGVTPSGKYSAGDGWKEYKRQLQDQRNAFNKTAVKLSTELKDLNPENKNTTGFIGVEGGDFLEGQIEKTEEAHRDGVRSIQLVHYAPNEVGDLQTAENTFNGLSSFGKELVKKMNELGMAIDVAHATYQTVKDVVSITNAPIILSHSILEMETDRPLARRAISKEHARLVSGTGGLIGAWPSGFNKSFDEFVDNIKRLTDTVGVDHVGIGTDMDGNFKPVLSGYSQFPQLEAALVSKGFSATEAGKIMGENSKNVLSKIFKMK